MRRLPGVKRVFEQFPRFFLPMPTVSFLCLRKYLCLETFFSGHTFMRNTIEQNDWQHQVTLTTFPWTEFLRHDAKGTERIGGKWYTLDVIQKSAKYIFQTFAQ